VPPGEGRRDQCTVSETMPSPIAVETAVVVLPSRARSPGGEALRQGAEQADNEGAIWATMGTSVL
jgi:hypothetical protein